MCPVCMHAQVESTYSSEAKGLFLVLWKVYTVYPEEHSFHGFLWLVRPLWNLFWEKLMCIIQKSNYIVWYCLWLQMWTPHNMLTILWHILDNNVGMVARLEHASKRLCYFLFSNWYRYEVKSSWLEVPVKFKMLNFWQSA